MAVFLDIDADFMFSPRTSGNTLTRQKLWVEPDDLLKKLKAAGLKWKGSPVALFTDHKEAYFVWKERGAHLNTLVHVDAHSDLYDTFSCFLHCGNFLNRALEEHMFSKVVWVMPDWLAADGEWMKWDLPFASGRGGQACLGNGQDPDGGGEAPEDEAADDNWGKIRCGSDGRQGHILIGHGKAELCAVSLAHFKMPNTRVALVTLATSPAFVPADKLAPVRELTEKITRDASRVEVRPNIPLSLEDPRLRELLKADFVEAGPPGVPSYRAGGVPGGWRATAGYLWAEHRAMAEGCG